VAVILIADVSARRGERASDLRTMDAIIALADEVADEPSLRRTRSIVIHRPQAEPAHRGEQTHRDDQDDRQRQAPALILRASTRNTKMTGRRDERPGIAGELLLIGEFGPLEAEARPGQAFAASRSIAASA